MQTILVVDGSNFLHRAFHAMPDLRTKAGEPTGALRGFISMLKAVAEAFPAEALACTFDPHCRTFRHELFADYKGNRPPMDPDLAAQTGLMREAAALLGWHVLEYPGYEADDVMGTIAKKAKDAGWRCLIASGDKDLSQLVGGSTFIVTAKNELLDAEGVFAKYGVHPDRIIDWLTLMGDTSDNVPGVQGCGPKTAARWLAQYGSLEALVGQAASVKGKAGERLRESLPWIPTGKRLVTIVTDVPLGEGFADMAGFAAQEPRHAELAGFYERWEFRSWAAQERALAPKAPEAGDLFADSDAPQAPAPQEQQTDEPLVMIEDPQALAAWFAAATGPVALEAVRDGAGVASELVGCAAACGARACYVPVAGGLFGDGALRAALLGQIAALSDLSVHDAKSALHALPGVPSGVFADDTMLQDYVLAAHLPHGLPEIASRILGERVPGEEELVGKGASRVAFASVEVPKVAEWACARARAVLRCSAAMGRRLQEQPRLASVYRTIEMPVMGVLLSMERSGVLVDAQQLAAQSEEMARQIAALEAKAHAIAGHAFNLSSPKQLAQILFEEMGIKPLKKTAGGTPSTSEDILEELALDWPLPKVILEYRRLTKLKGTYTDKLPQLTDAAGRVHTTFGQAVAVTGRLSSLDPNLQNIPVRTAEGRRIRDAFVAPAGCTIVSADYSQIELRVMAHLSDDPGLLRAFAQGQDVHRATASEVFGVPPEDVSADQRRMAKVVNFGLIYGMSPFGLAKNLGTDRETAKVYVDRYFARYPKVAEFMRQTRTRAREQGYVETAFGRQLWLPDIRSSNFVRRSGAERSAINAPMQGTAADLIKRAMIAVEAWLRGEKLESRLVLQVHDELILEVPDAELERVREALPRLMAGAGTLSVPLIAEVGTGASWGAAH